MITVMILQGGEDKTLQIYMDKAFLPVWVMVCLIAVLLCMVTIIIITMYQYHDNHIKTDHHNILSCQILHQSCVEINIFIIYYY